MTSDRGQVAKRLVVGSLVWSALVSVLLLFVPTVTSQTCTAGRPDTIEECTTRAMSLLQSEGLSIVPSLLVPVVIPLVALSIRHVPRAVLIGLGVGYLLLAAVAILSLGAFYLPAAVALLLAGAMSRRTTVAT